MGSKRILGFSTALMLTQPWLSATAASAESSEIQTITYVPDYKTIFPNPERGFSQYVDIIDPKFFPREDEPYFFYRPYLPEGAAEASASRIIHSYIRLDYYGDIPQLPRELLDDLAKGLTEVRREGMKIVLRCAYSMTMDWPRDIPIETIMSHMKQINKVISANADVVLAIEAGYFGPWSERHDNICVTWQDRIRTDNPVGIGARAILLKGLLETTPDNVKIAIRYPDYLKEIIESEMFTQAEKDRFGSHDDGIAQDKKYNVEYTAHLKAALQYINDLPTSEGFHRYYGGGTDPSMDIEGYIDGYKILDEAYDSNLTEYNGSWSIPDIWFTTKLPATGNDPAETTYQRFMRKIGYRLRLVSASFRKSAKPGDTFDFSAVIDNDGFAGPINPRPVFLVFDNGTTRRNVRLNGIEVRSWLGGDDHSGPYNIEAKDIKVPADLPAGNYTLALWLPDSFESLQSRPEYSIRLANKYMWDAQRGYNKLGVIVIGSTEAGMSGWAKYGVESAVNFGVATPELCNNYKSVTTRAEFCRAVVNLLEQYYNMPVAGIIHKRDLLLLEQPFGYWPGDTDEIVMTRTLGPYDDYSVCWNIPGNGVVAIDNITITEKGVKTPLASFNFEIPPLKPEPSTGSYSLSAKEMQDIHTNLGLQSIYRDFLERRRAMLTVIPSFTDTSDPAIRAAAALGITSGTGNGTFSPDAPLTREQAATMLTNVLKIIGENTSSAPAVKWSDDKSISSWAQSAADVMYSYKIMSGTSATDLVFSPKSPYTHEQSLLTLNNLWKYLESK
ncbi:MAG: DUF4832 domain-containing protein [Clostridiaceae bacterium]|nr:DUF4832 domain-containing protein [Clostridiaceae bacterium]